MENEDLNAVDESGIITATSLGEASVAEVAAVAGGEAAVVVEAVEAAEAVAAVVVVGVMAGTSEMTGVKTVGGHLRTSSEEGLVVEASIIAATIATTTTPIDVEVTEDLVQGGQWALDLLDLLAMEVARLHLRRPSHNHRPQYR